MTTLCRFVFENTISYLDEAPVYTVLISFFSQKKKYNIYFLFWLLRRFSKEPFIIVIFQLCPLGKKTANRQEHCLAIGKKKRKRENVVCFLAQRFPIQVTLSLLFSLLSADTKSHMWDWKYMFYAAWRNGCIEAQSSHFYSFVPRWRGNEGEEQMLLLRE